MSQMVTDPTTGQQHSFPDEATPEMISQALGLGGTSSEFPPYVQPPNPNEHLTKMLGGAMIEGGAGLAGVPGDLINAIPKLSDADTKAAAATPSLPGDEGIQQLAASGGLSLPTSQRLLSGAKDLGLVGQPIQQPQNEGERFMAAAARGMAGTAPLGALGGGFAGLGKAALQGIMSGVGGEAGRILPINENSTAATLAGVLAGQTLGGGLYGAAGRGINAMRGVGNPIINAYDTAGVTPRLLGDVTGKPGLQALQSMAMRSPGGGRAVGAAQAGANEFGSGVENAAAAFGKSRTLDEAGAALQAEAPQWLDRWNKDQAAAWAPIKAGVPAQAPVDMTGVEQVLNHARSAMPGAPEIANVMTSPTANNLQDALRQVTARGVPIPHPGTPMAPYAGTGPNIAWQDADGFRQKVGEELQNSLLARDGQDKMWRGLYGSLADAQGNTATAFGLGKEYENAKAVTSAGHLFADNVLNKILNNRNPAQNTIRPNDAASFALSDSSTGGDLLNKIRQEMPQAADELAAYKLRDMAVATPGKATQDMPTSATTFSRQLNLLAPEARTALFGSSPRIDALQTVAERGKETYARYGNAPGTAGAIQHGLVIPSIVAGGIGGHELGGLPGAITGAGIGALPFVTGPALGNLTTREMLTRYLAAPTGGPGVGASRLYRGAGGISALAPLLSSPTAPGQ
jgi:hypothetical protein